MSLTALTLDVLRQVLSQLKVEPAQRRVLSLGYPDVLASPDEIRRVFGDELFGRLAFRDDAGAITGWHNVRDRTEQVVDAGSLFAALGYRLDVIDIVAARGGEIIHDLNTPVPADMHGRYALVLDAGTLEHCFNIAEAARNVASMVMVGGIAMHGNPLNMYNHGLYNLNPVWYHDFYAGNCFSVDYMKLVVDPVRNPRLFDVPAHDRFRQVPENAVLVTLARRLRGGSIGWPVQEKYREHPTLSGG